VKVRFRRFGSRCAEVKTDVGVTEVGCTWRWGMQCVGSGNARIEMVEPTRGLRTWLSQRGGWRGNVVEKAVVDVVQPTWAEPTIH
jgi:hypothetical protein